LNSSLARTPLLFAVICLAVAWIVAPAAANACLDHSHSADGAGSRAQAQSEARKSWSYSVRMDDGARWARIDHARNAKMICRTVDAAKGPTVCTFKARPCADR